MGLALGGKAENKVALDAAAWVFNIVTSVGIIMVNKALMATHGFRFVAQNTSLHDFLDSYLQFRHRWYDLPHRGPKGTVAGLVVGELELCRRVFMVLYRISSNKDPGAGQGESLSMKEHTALLQEKRLLDLPKLLDICAIYGHDNGKLTSSLVTNAINVQPNVLDGITGAREFGERSKQTRYSTIISYFIVSTDVRIPDE